MDVTPRLTRNLADWDRFEKAAIEHRVILSAYAGGDLDLSTPEGAYYGGMETLRAKRESAVRSVRVREAHDRIARQGKIPGGAPLVRVDPDLRQPGGRPAQADHPGARPQGVRPADRIGYGVR